MCPKPSVGRGGLVARRLGGALNHPPATAIRENSASKNIRLNSMRTMRGNLPVTQKAMPKHGSRIFGIVGKSILA